MSQDRYRYQEGKPHWYPSVAFVAKRFETLSFDIQNMLTLYILIAQVWEQHTHRRNNFLEISSLDAFIFGCIKKGETLLKDTVIICSFLLIVIWDRTFKYQMD